MKPAAVPIPGTRLFVASMIVLGTGLGVTLLLLGRETGVLPFLGGPPVGRLTGATPGAEIGRIRRQAGTVLHKEEEAVEWMRAAVGMTLFSDDRVRTSGQSAAVLEVEGNQISMSENALVVVRPSRIRLEGGSADVQLGEGSSLAIDLAGAQVRARRQEIAFLAAPLALPGPGQDATALRSSFVGALVEALGDATAAEPLRARLAEEAQARAAGRSDQARRIQEELWNQVASLHRRNSAAGPARISISRDAGGNERIQVLEGSVAVKSGAQARNLTQGTGALVRAGGGAVEEHALLTAPEPSAPSAEELLFNRRRVPLAWTALDGAVDYQVEIARTQDFNDIVWRQWIAGTELEPAVDLADGDYYWQVRARDADGFSGLVSPPRHFTLATDRDPPPLKLKRRSDWKK